MYPVVYRCLALRLYLPDDVVYRSVGPLLWQLWQREHLERALESGAWQIHQEHSVFMPLNRVYRAPPTEHFPYGEALTPVVWRDETLLVPRWLWDEAGTPVPVVVDAAPTAAPVQPTTLIMVSWLVLVGALMYTVS